MTVPSYTEEDVELVAASLPIDYEDHTTLVEVHPGNETAEPRFVWGDPRRVARAILDALSSSGRLVPLGSEVREEWGVRHHFQTGALGDTRLGSEEDAMEVLVARVACGLRTDLIRRSVITTPWSPSVPDTEEGS